MSCLLLVILNFRVALRLFLIMILFGLTVVCVNYVVICGLFVVWLFDCLFILVFDFAFCGGWCLYFSVSGGYVGVWFFDCLVFCLGIACVWLINSVGLI